MAKQMFPQLKSGGGLLRKLVVLAVLITVVVLVARYPTDAAAWARSAGHAIGAFVDGLVTFVRSLGS